MTEHAAGEVHLPHGSVWPFWIAIGITFVGLGMIFSSWSIVLPVAGIVFLCAMIGGWVREDFVWWKTNTGTGPGMARAGTLMFISSEVFIFGALFATYFTFKGQADHWPDANVHLPLLKTGFFSLFLFASSATIHQAEKHLKNGNKKGFHNWWLATIILGAIFLYGQADEYITLVHEGFGLTASQFMTSFYMITGTHGLHVLGGGIYLVIVYIRSIKGQFDAERHAAPQTAAMYWHFVDLVWIIVFTVLYIMNAGGGGHA